LGESGAGAEKRRGLNAGLIFECKWLGWVICGNGHSTGFVFGRDVVDLEASATKPESIRLVVPFLPRGERENVRRETFEGEEFKATKFVYARKRRLLFGSLGTDRQHIVNYGQLFCQSPLDDESNL